jgi:hypothetical protein
MDPASLANNPNVMRMMHEMQANAANVGKQAEFVRKHVCPLSIDVLET